MGEVKKTCHYLNNSIKLKGLLFQFRHRSDIPQLILINKCHFKYLVLLIYLIFIYHRTIQIFIKNRVWKLSLVGLSGSKFSMDKNHGRKK